jgi:hypothetical protein
LHLKRAFPFLLWEMKSVPELHSTHCGPQTYGDKIDVEKSLQKKTYNVLRVARTSLQQQLYSWLLTKNVAKLNEGTRRKGMGPKTTLRIPYYGAEKILQPLLFFRKYRSYGRQNYSRKFDFPHRAKFFFLTNSCLGSVRRGIACLLPP